MCKFDETVSLSFPYCEGLREEECDLFSNTFNHGNETVDGIEIKFWVIRNQIHGCFKEEQISKSLFC